MIATIIGTVEQVRAKINTVKDIVAKRISLRGFFLSIILLIIKLPESSLTTKIVRNQAEISALMPIWSVA